MNSACKPLTPIHRTVSSSVRVYNSQISITMFDYTDLALLSKDEKGRLALLRLINKIASRLSDYGRDGPKKAKINRAKRFTPASSFVEDVRHPDLKRPSRPLSERC